MNEVGKDEIKRLAKATQDDDLSFACSSLPSLRTERLLAANALYQPRLDQALVAGSWHDQYSVHNVSIREIRTNYYTS
jgi:hypothetical protein